MSAQPMQLWGVLALLAAAMVCFVRGKPRMDVVALVVLVALPACGLLTVPEALAGFSDPNVLLIAALFVVGQGLVRTGVAWRLGNWLARMAHHSETRLIVLLMLTVAALGSVMSSTGVVALFIPVLLRVADRLCLQPARLMMPLAFAGLTSGMMTLVGTPPNLVVHAELQRHGLAGFGFFTVTPFGLLILALGIAYMLLARRWLHQQVPQAEACCPRLTLDQLSRAYRLGERQRRLRVRPDSPLIGQVLGELALRRQYGLNVIGVERRRPFGNRLLLATRHTLLQAGDVLLVDQININNPNPVNNPNSADNPNTASNPNPAVPGSAGVSSSTTPELDLRQTRAALGLEPVALSSGWFSLHAPQLGLAEVAFPPESTLPGKTIHELGFRSQHRLHVVGLKRRDARQHSVVLDGVPLDERIQPLDTLLVAGDWKAIARLHGLSRDFLVLSLPAEAQHVAPALHRAPHALCCLALMIALMVSGVLPNVLAALLACLLMGAFRCVDMDSAWRAIHWPTLMLIVGMLPFASALQRSGGIDLAVQALMRLSETGAGASQPYPVLACLFALTALIGLFISNTATAVLMAPVALAAAQALHASPLPFAMIVTLAASSAFMTPVSSPVNTLVLGPGGYRFVDFVRVGVPFALLVMLLCVWLVPVWLPLQATIPP